MRSACFTLEMVLYLTTNGSILCQAKRDSFSLTGTRSNFNSIINDNILAGYLENFQYIIIKSERNRMLELR